MKRKDHFDEFHQWHQVSKAERAGSLWGDGEGSGGGESGSAAPAATRVEGLLSDQGARISLTTRAETADVPSRHEVREALRRAAAESVADLVQVPYAPQSNTGHKFTVHWAEMTVFASVETVADLVAAAFIESYTPFDGDGGLGHFQDVGPVRFYGRLLRGPGGICIKAENKVGSAHCSVQITGEGFDVHGSAPLARLMASLEDQQVRWHLTRIDLAFDGVAFSPRRVYLAIKKGKVRSLAERDSLHFEETPFGEDAGDTCNFGVRGSADFLRVYDRRATGTRVEHECRGNRAKWLGLQLVNAPLDQWHRIALANLRDFIDLVKPKGKNVSRWKLLPWWRAFVQDVERCHVRISDGLEALRARAAATVETVKATAKGIVRRAAKLFVVAGEQAFLAMIKNAVPLLRPSDECWIADARAVVGTYCDAWALSPADVFAKVLRAEGGGG